MKTIHIPVITLVLLQISCGLDAQSWKEKIVSGLRSGGQHINIEYKDLGPGESREIIEFINPYFFDSTYFVRAGAMEVVHKLASASDDTVTRQMSVHILLSKVDRDPALTRSALSMLTAYRAADFTLQARDTLGMLVLRNTASLNSLLRLSGFLKMNNLQAPIRKYTLRGHPPATRWAALVSLARMGDLEAISDILNRIDKIPVNDNTVYNIIPDMIYTRQPEVIDYVLRLIQNNEKNCFSADAEREAPIPCAYRILEQLATVIEDIPVEVDPTGDLATNDYPAALAAVRDWLRNRSTYTIRNDKY